MAISLLFHQSASRASFKGSWRQIDDHLPMHPKPKTHRIWMSCTASHSFSKIEIKLFLFGGKYYLLLFVNMHDDAMPVTPWYHPMASLG